MDRLAHAAALAVAAALLLTTPDRAPTAPVAQTEARPPGSRWLVDTQGRRYYVERIAKRQTDHRPDGSVVTTWGVPLEVVREDATYVYFKVFRTTETALEPTPKVENTRDSFRVSTAMSSRFRFSRISSHLPTSGQWRSAFAVADMNEDGRPDIVATPPRKNLGKPRIFLSDGRGRFSPWTDARFPDAPYDYGAAAVGDFNGDEHQDVALGIHLHGVMALRGNGRGAFEDASGGLDAPPADGAPASFSSQALGAVDWNGDGRTDLVALGEGPRLGQKREAAGSARGVVIYRNTADGFVPQRIENGLFGQSIATGQIDGDGFMDAVAGTSVFGDRNIAVLGTRDGGARTFEVGASRTNSYILAVALADVSGDDRADIVAAYLNFTGGAWRSGIDVYVRRANSWSRRPLFVRRDESGIYALDTGDINADGRVDIVALTGAGETLVFPGDGRGWLTRERRPPSRFRGSCRGSHVELVNLDTDRGDEIVASFAEESDDPGRCPSGGGFAVWKAR